jgi:hypothetical protein
MTMFAFLKKVNAPDPSAVKGHLARDVGPYHNCFAQIANVPFDGLSVPPQMSRALSLAPASPFAWAGSASLCREGPQADMWSHDGGRIIEQLASRISKYRWRHIGAACERWPGWPSLPAKGTRVIGSPVRLREDA